MARFQLWLRDAPASEVRITALVGAVVLCLLGWALLPTGSRTEGLSVGAGPFEGQGGQEYGSSEPTGAGGGVPGAEAGANATGTVGTATGTSAPGARTRGSTTSVSGVNGESSGPDGGSTTTIPLTATDRGVSATSIKVGFSTLNLGPVEQAGKSGTGLRSDVKEAVLALVEGFNKAGGVNGRKLAAVIKSVDALNANDQRAKCLEFVQADRVFAVLDFAGMATQRQCLTVENKTPYVNSTALDAKTQRVGHPYDVTLTKNANRAMKDLVFSAKDAGLFDAAKGFTKVGLLEAAPDYSTFDDPDTGLRAYLKKVGLRDDQINVFRLSHDVATQQRETAQAVLQFKQADVNLVFPMAFYVTVQSFLQNAETQQFRPTYYIADYLQLGSDTSAKNFNPNQWDRTRAVTQMTSGELNAGKPQREAAKTCSKYLTDAGLPPITDYDGPNWEVAAFCDSLTLFVASARAAGPNLTRDHWAAALPRVGSLNLVTVDASVFDRPGKVSGGDTIATIEWRRECTCWHQIAPHRPAYG